MYNKLGLQLLIILIIKYSIKFSSDLSSNYIKKLCYPVIVFLIYFFY